MHAGFTKITNAYDYIIDAIAAHPHLTFWVCVGIAALILLS
jgi:hypothetical protein